MEVYGEESWEKYGASKFFWDIVACRQLPPPFPPDNTPNCLYFSLQKLPREYIFVVLMWFANSLSFQLAFTLAFTLSLPLIPTSSRLLLLPSVLLICSPVCCCSSDHLNKPDQVQQPCTVPFHLFSFLYCTPSWLVGSAVVYSQSLHFKYNFFCARYIQKHMIYQKMGRNTD